MKLSKLLKLIPIEKVQTRLRQNVQNTKTARGARISISQLHNLHFTPDDKGLGDLLSVSNLSVSGVALTKEYLKRVPAAGAEISGELLIGEDVNKAVLRVVHSAGGIVGCMFIEPTPSLVTSIQLYLYLELDAVEVKKVPDDILKPVAEGNPHWYCGGNNCELYFVENEGELLWFNISFLGNYIEGGNDMPVRFGYEVLDDNAKAGRIRWDNTLAESLSDLAVRFLNSIKDLESDYKTLVKEKLKTGG
ncbi:MAG: hypothetical protein AABZ06_11835 [Bdellovibrionota bacterium]